MKADFFNIQKILLDYWDPIGIGDNLNLKDEYDFIIPVLLKYLNRQDVSENLFYEMLKDIEVEIGMETSDRVRKITTLKLIELLK